MQRATKVVLKQKKLSRGRQAAGDVDVVTGEEKEKDEEDGAHDFRDGVKQIFTARRHRPVVRHQAARCHGYGRGASQAEG